MEMDKKEIRAVIKYLFLKNLSPKEIHTDMVETMNDHAPSYSTVKQWVGEFKRGRVSTDDAERSGRPCSATDQETSDKVLEMVMQDRQITLRYISEQFKIS